MRAALVLLAALLLSGCSGDSVSYRLGGSFTQSRTSADLDDFQTTVAPYSDDVAIMESFPEQFSIRDLDSDGCAELRGKLMAKTYLAAVSTCVAYTLKA